MMHTYPFDNNCSANLKEASPGWLCQRFLYQNRGTDYQRAIAAQALAN